MPYNDCAVFPGSFDPLTYGHLDIITRALKMFDRVIVAVLSNPEKASLFTIEERREIIEGVLVNEAPRVEVRSFSGLLVDFASSMNTRVIVRGLRAVSDYDFEAQMALANRRLNSEIETLFLFAREEYSYISSTLVKQIARFGGNVSNFVPPLVEERLRAKFSAV